MIFFFLFLLLRGRGEGVEVGFFPSFEMWKEGKGVTFSLQFFFHCGIAEEGKGFFFFTNSLWGEGLVGSSYFQNTRHSWV